MIIITIILVIVIIIVSYYYYNSSDSDSDRVRRKLAGWLAVSLVGVRTKNATLSLTRSLANTATRNWHARPPHRLGWLAS